LTSVAEKRDAATPAPERFGVLVANLGTPDAPTPEAVRRYLAQFLHDHRVVDLTRWLWCPILHGIILRTRPQRVARAYGSVWTERGSPLLYHSQDLAEGIAESLGVEVALGMTYGEPSLSSALDQLQEAGVDKVVVLPFYPQYSGTTTAAVFDGIARALEGRPRLPALRFIDDYHQWPAYLDALARSATEYWQEHGEPDRLLISFHGIPQRYHRNGDPYPDQCKATAEGVAQRLALPRDRITTTFQSRFGREPWLEPYTDQTLEAWGAEGCGRVDVMCPGFAADCLETLEEIAMEGRESYLEAGGGELHYIPALNARSDHVQALSERIRVEAGDWLRAAAVSAV